MKILAFSLSKKEKKTFWGGHLKNNIFNSFALLQIGIEEFKKLLDNLNQNNRQKAIVKMAKYPET